MDDRVPMTDLLTRVRATIEEMAQASGGSLDGTDESIWFIYGALLDDSRERPAGMVLAYAVYVADLLAGGIDSVEVAIEADGNHVREVTATRHQRVQGVLSWVLKCIDDPDADNIVFKYACALRDFGQAERAKVLDSQLALFSTS
jgi:hypothetical protein